MKELDFSENKYSFLLRLLISKVIIAYEFTERSKNGKSVYQSNSWQKSSTSNYSNKFKLLHLQCTKEVRDERLAEPPAGWKLKRPGGFTQLWWWGFRPGLVQKRGCPENLQALHYQGLLSRSSHRLSVRGFLIVYYSDFLSWKETQGMPKTDKTQAKDCLFSL